MRKRKDIEQEIDAVLNSMDGSERATPGDFFYTRLQARMQQERPGLLERLAGFMSRPSVAITGIAVILLINGATMLKQWYTAPARQDQVALQAFAEEYSLGVVTFYEDEKTEP
ncbi:hypothetical protein MKQ68_04570 [Chitinophaga horti]|uniref:DUF3619 family protein n=1 Tax=Chitinophaga horti TaxID=2920382 RepID=A0ABY6J412_9BACT|nr:hypothetical protein [Chitinophaga horti]UYQ94362.1 hypothetical protein MKQ68_04570 [Chitinophaga horti]